MSTERRSIDRGDGGDSGRDLGGEGGGGGEISAAPEVSEGTEPRREQRRRRRRRRQPQSQSQSQLPPPPPPPRSSTDLSRLSSPALSLTRYTASVTLSYLSETDGLSLLLCDRTWSRRVLPMFRRRIGSGTAAGTTAGHRYRFVVVPARDPSALLDGLNTRRLRGRIRSSVSVSASVVSEGGDGGAGGGRSSSV